MNQNYYRIFSRKLYEAEVEEKLADSESDLDKILTKSPKVDYTLARLITSQKGPGLKADEEIRDIVSDIKVISYRPTTFRIVLKNSNYFDLVYDPTPMQLKSDQKVLPSDMFKVAILGKRYDLANNSNFEQALDYIGICMKSNPIDDNNPDLQQQDTSGGEEGDGGKDLAPLPGKQ